MSKSLLTSKVCTPWCSNFFSHLEFIHADVQIMVRIWSFCSQTVKSPFTSEADAQRRQIAVQFCKIYKTSQHSSKNIRKTSSQNTHFNRWYHQHKDVNRLRRVSKCASESCNVSRLGRSHKDLSEAQTGRWKCAEWYLAWSQCYDFRKSIFGTYGRWRFFL